MDMSEDEQRVIADALCNPLNPGVAVSLCSTCQSLRGLMHAQLQQLRERHSASLALCAHLGTSCEAVLGSSRLNWRFNALGPPECHVVGMLFLSKALSSLKDLHLDGNPLTDEGMGTLAAGLVPGAMPALVSLVCIDTQLGDRAAADLGRAIAQRGLPALTSLNLNQNQIGDSGVQALAAGLRGIVLDTLMLDANLIGDRGLRLLVSEAASLTALKHLSLSANQVTDHGLRALVEMDRDAMPALELIWLDENQIGDAGLRQLASALAEGSVLPQLEDIYLDGNPASDAAKGALKSVLGGSEADEVPPILD